MLTFHIIKQINTFKKEDKIVSTAVKIHQGNKDK